MFEISSKKVDFGKENILIKRNINLDSNLDCFILISTNDKNFGDLIINNILEFIIDKISKEKSYNDFSIALESINSFIKTWESDGEKKIKLDIIIGILNDNNYIFSNIGNSSCYLLNKENEIVELTNKEDKRKSFNFVSSGKIKNNEIVISSTKRLLNYLSKSDLLDGLVLSEDINIFNKNIKNILLSEPLEKNILVSSLKYVSSENKEDSKKIDSIKNNLMKTLDNKFSKNVLAHILILKDKINSQSKMIKSIILLIGITIGIFFLYSSLSTVVSVTTQNEDKQVAKENIIKAKTYLRIASENVANPDAFELNIKNAEDLLTEIEKEQVFLNDISKINDDINTLKKQFNKVEIIENNPENIIYLEDIKDPVRVIKNNSKTYIVTSKGIIGPIIPNVKTKNYSFSSLEENETFVDATFIGDNMYILTSLSKIVKFTKNGYFSYMDVSGQKIWQKSKEIDSYYQNIYLIGEENNQIYKHNLVSNKFKSGIGYLKNDDLTQIGEILSIAIDGGFYILKKDLSIIKFFNSPKYRIEKIIINKLPKNYDIEDPDSIIDLKTRGDLNYVYLLMNNKIWIFKPNTKNIQQTKSLTYLGQIEGEKNEIKDFFINHDGEVIILNNNGLFKVNFEISDDRVLIR